MKEVIYVQYTNPGGYPPLEHSSDVFLSMGLRTLFLGVEIRSLNGLDFPGQEGREVRLLPWVKPGLGRKLLYLCFVVWTVATCIKRRPALVYCSDAYSCPAALVLEMLGLNVLYHEHDLPGPRQGRFHALVLAFRRRVFQHIAVLVPSEARRDLVLTEGAKDVKVVWNCPSKAEVARRLDEKNRSVSGPLRVVYQGSIAPDRLPPNLVRAMVSDSLRGRVELKIIGYEVGLGVGLVSELLEIASSSGAPNAVEHLGSMPRQEMLAVGSTFDIGLSLMTIDPVNANLATVLGASNKPFDYMAQGLPLFCSDLPEWKEMLGEFAIFCDPRSVASISKALENILDRRAHWAEIGSRGQQKVLHDWNYEALFGQHGLPATGLQ